MANLSYTAHIEPSTNTVPTVKKDGEIVVHIPNLTTTNRNAVELLLNEIAAGTDISAVVTAINAL